MKRGAPEVSVPRPKTEGRKFANITANPQQLTPAGRVDRGSGLQGLLEQEKGSQTPPATKKTRVRLEDAKSAYRRFVGPEIQKNGHKGHYCLLSVTSANQYHGGCPHPEFIGSTDISNIKSHFETWHKEVSFDIVYL
jgi:hypothetical protein